MLSPDSLASLFDPQNIDHVKAYQQLEKTGCWPPNFHSLFPKNMIVTSICYACIRAKLAEAWVEHKLKE